MRNMCVAILSAAAVAWISVSITGGTPGKVEDRYVNPPSVLGAGWVPFRRPPQDEEEDHAEGEDTVEDRIFLFEQMKAARERAEQDR